MTPERLSAIKTQTQNAILDWKLQTDDPCDLLDAQWELVQSLEHAQEELVQSLEHAQEELTQAIAKIEEEQAESRRLVTVCAAFRHDRDALKVQISKGCLPWTIVATHGEPDQDVPVLAVVGDDPHDVVLVQATVEFDINNDGGSVATWLTVDGVRIREEVLAWTPLPALPDGCAYGPRRS